MDAVRADGIASGARSDHCPWTPTDDRRRRSPFVSALGSVERSPSERDGRVDARAPLMLDCALARSQPTDLSHCSPLCARTVPSDPATVLRSFPQQSPTNLLCSSSSPIATKPSIPHRHSSCDPFAQHCLCCVRCCCSSCRCWRRPRRVDRVAVAVATAVAATATTAMATQQRWLDGQLVFCSALTAACLGGRGGGGERWRSNDT